MKWFAYIISAIVAYELIRWLVRRAVGSVRVTGSPTPPSARIEHEAQANKDAIDAAAEAEKQKVNNASGEDLRASFVDRMFRRDRLPPNE